MNRIILKTLSLSLLVFNLLGCKGFQKTNNKEVSDIPIIDSVETISDVYCFEDFTKNWHGVILDDSTIDAMIEVIGDVMYDDSLFFVDSYNYLESQRRRILAFNNEGNFIRQIGLYGRAKNEYQGIGAWTIDKKNKEVVIFDNHKCIIKRYNYNGDFLGDYQLDYSVQQISNIFTLGDSLYLFQMSIVEEPSDDYILFNRNTSTKTGIFPIRDIYTEGFFMGGYGIQCGTNDTLKYLRRNYDDIVYTIDNNGNIKEQFKLGFIPSINKQILKGFSIDNMDARDHIFQIYELTDYIIFDSFSGTYLIDKRTNRTTRYYSKNGYRISNSNIPLASLKVGVDRNYLIIAVDQPTAESQSLHTDRYTEEVNEFYKKAAKNENYSLVLYEIDK
jgi:hypothetical protein